MKKLLSISISFAKERALKITNVFVLLMLIITGNSNCGDDDEGPSTFINTGSTDVSYTEINKCDAGGGVFYTEYFFTIPYETSQGLEIEKIIYSIKASGSTNTPTEKEKTTFEDTGTEINFILCLQFAGASSLDFTSQLGSADNIKSVKRTYIIVRPTGAN
jgi:hypothetical protein